MKAPQLNVVSHDYRSAVGFLQINSLTDTRGSANAMLVGSQARRRRRSALHTPGYPDLTLIAERGQLAAAVVSA